MPQLWLEMPLPMSNMMSPIQLSDTQLSPQTKTEWKMLCYFINVLIQMAKREVYKDQALHSEWNYGTGQWLSLLCMSILQWHRWMSRVPAHDGRDWSEGPRTASYHRPSPLHTFPVHPRGFCRFISEWGVYACSNLDFQACFNCISSVILKAPTFQILRINPKSSIAGYLET